ncbi:MAG: cobaltochelatase subunit CobN [Candidatus Promineifilaceae bacterium]
MARRPPARRERDRLRRAARRHRGRGPQPGQPRARPARFRRLLPVRRRPRRRPPKPLTGAQPAVYHNDHSRPERPVTRTLEEEIARVVRARVVNPKWIDGVKRHGYKGAFEIIATVDYMFAFAATTGAVQDPPFRPRLRSLHRRRCDARLHPRQQPLGYDELIAKFDEARRRGYWTRGQLGA